ncbi:MAG: hypothetical protein QOH08_305, partial [Chloroflexota bacterium]|nr:hypothetical protein [Chloroflexota bacterium]
LMDPELPAYLSNLSERYPCASPVTLELTESTLMNDPEGATRVILDLRTRGFRFAIDDFGVGYSSLAYLNRLPIDEVKIDRSFVGTFETDPRSALIVRATIELAHNLGLRAVAEGVEREETRTALATMGCDRYQGYLMSRPLGSIDLVAFMNARALKAVPQVIS